MIRMPNMRDDGNICDDTHDAVHNDARRIDNENGDVTVAGSTIKPEQTDGIEDAVREDAGSGTQSPMRRLVAQLMKFGVVGIIAFVIDYGVMVALTELLGLNPVLSATISFTVSVVFNYVASMRYVFTHRDGMSRRREFVIFVALSVIGLGLNDLLMWFGTDTIGNRLPHRQDRCDGDRDGLQLRHPPRAARWRREVANVRERQTNG